ncbi:trichohyalin [Drosophila grimshawi]|uniref:trichohyalin n=1 Tax=Drosophila grimshawi TaxID=7222 RepID=UPI0013EF1D79|nr:trichohyalin [Drosophila grimshawi]
MQRDEATLTESSIGRLKISLMLPRLANDLDRVMNQLRFTFYEPARNLLRNMLHLDVLKMEEFNADVLHIIDYFQHHFDIHEMFPELLETLSIQDRQLIDAFENLLKVAERHLRRTSRAEINMERKLHIMFQERERVQTRIEYYRKQLRSKNAVLRWKQAARRIILENQENDLASKKWKNNVRIQNEIEKRSRILGDNHKSSLEKQEELRQELDKARRDYELLIQKNAQREKEMRAEKNKLLIQLEGILQKYDNNIGEKLRENLQLEDQYKVAKKELDDFMVDYREEEAIYNRIVVTHEREEQRKQQERILIFMMNRAARKIQKYYLKWRRDQKLKARKARKSKRKN